MGKPTKTQLVRNHLVSKGSITSLQAIKNYSATRLSAIIFNLIDEGWTINKVPCELTDDAGYKEIYTKYILVSKPQQ